MTHSKAIAASSDLPPNTLQPEHRCDVLIVGCGVAGLSLALELPQSVSVCIIAKGDLSQSCTYYAQGGIAAALDEGDSCQAHAEDTIEAGVRLCDEKAVNQITEAGAVTIEWLQSMGVTFNYEKNITHGYKLHLTREGGHSHKRIAHYYDTTGKNILSNLYEKAQSRKNILISNHFIAVDLVVEKTHKQCVGVYALNKKARKVHTIARLSNGSCNRRSWQDIPLHDQPRQFLRRWHRNGMACWLPHCEYAPNAVPPDRTLPP